MTNKQRWRQEGNVDYIKVEVRPPRRKQDKGDYQCQMTLEWLPRSDSGAYGAFQALLGVLMAQRNPSQAKDFYKALRDFAERWAI